MRIDIGCSDLAAAARNREMVAKKRNIIGYIEVEMVLAGTPRWAKLPDWIPIGNLPMITKGDLRKARRAMHEENDIEY